MLRRALPAVVATAFAFCGGASALILAGPSGPAATTSTAATTPTSATTTSAAPTAIVVSGHGWGHGLGMSQWGAYGYAQHGWTYDQILAHYYPGTTLGPAPVSTARVLLLENRKKVVLSSAGAWRVADAEGTTQDLEPKKLTLTPALRVAGEQLASPLTFRAGPSPLLVGDKPYRGRLVVSSDGKTLQVVNVLGLEAYLKGVVPSEMPSGWATEALEAQAVAARSYALANVTKNRPFDLYGDVRSQVYGGLAAESPAASAAVDATKGRIVLFGGKVATTYFFSTSGGRTVSAAEATGKAVPYLVSVADPYDTASPYHDWGPVLVDAAKAAKALKVPAPVGDLTTQLGPSGHVLKGTVTAADGSQTTVTGPALRTALGLRSTWFTVGWLALTPPPAPVTYGGAATLVGAARNVGPVSLEARAAGAQWQTLAPLTPDAAGAVSTIVKPQATTEYRLAAGLVHAALVKVPVAPLVSATIKDGSATGTIVPPVAGAPVELQRQDGAVWTTVASGATDTTGAFALVGPTPPALATAYRVRAAPGHGLVPGFSQPACC